MTFTVKFQTLPLAIQQEITSQYTEYFPFEVRYILADEMAKYDWINLCEGDPQHAKFADALVKLFLDALTVKCNQIHDDADLKYRLQATASKIQSWIASNPFRLVNEVQRVLSIEESIISQFEGNVHINQPMVEGEIAGALDYINDELKGQLTSVTGRVGELHGRIGSICTDSSNLLVSIHEFQRQQLNYQKAQSTMVHRVPGEEKRLDDLQKEVFKTATKNCHGTQSWLEDVIRVLNDLKLIQHRVVNEKLAQWKREQQLANNGYPLSSGENSLSHVQELFILIADLLIQIRKNIYKCKSELDNLQNLFNTIEGSQSINQMTVNAMSMVDTQIESLIKSAFVIEKQPPQVMKTNIRFVATVTLLTGNRFYVDAQPRDVYAYIINEQEASQFLENPRPQSFTRETRKTSAKDAGANEILNNKADLETATATGHPIANFRNMQLKRIKRTEKKGTESVMDEKFAILFTSSFRILNGIEVFVWTISLPVVVIVHGNQEPHAWATITWDNAFALPSRKSFQVAHSVAWDRLAEVLNVKFKHFTNLNLTPEDLNFLACKVLRSPDSSHGHMVTWNLFAKDNLPERQFTFWEWFFAILKVAREPLKTFFQDKSIIGFLSRQQTEEMLLQRPPGTFLLRFSDSELGGVTIAWVGENADGLNEVFMVQPFTARDFSIRGLADRIGDLKHLKYLFPNIPKEQVFAQHYTQDQTPKANGYVKPVLALTLLGCGDKNTQSHRQIAPHQVPSHLMCAPVSRSSDSPLSDGLPGIGFMQSYAECSSESSSVSSVVPEYDYVSNSAWNPVISSDVEAPYHVLPLYHY